VIGEIPDLFTAEAAAAQAMPSIDDYGKDNSGPYQIVQPAYPAPVWLNQFVSLIPALRECSTLCTLQGKPFRVMSWNREGAGRAGGVPCGPCGNRARIPRWPRRVLLNGSKGPGCLDGFEAALPVAEVRPGGQWIVYDCRGNETLVGSPNYVVSHTPFPRLYEKEVYPQRYLEAVKTAEYLASTSGRRTFVCSSFGAKCNGGRGTPVVYVDPGGYRQRYDDVPANGVPSNALTVRTVSPGYFKELVMESAGGTYLGQGA
jgi:hypothetical protein